MSSAELPVKESSPIPPKPNNSSVAPDPSNLLFPPLPTKVIDSTNIADKLLTIRVSSLLRPLDYEPLDITDAQLEFSRIGTFQQGISPTLNELERTTTIERSTNSSRICLHSTIKEVASIAIVLNKEIVTSPPTRKLTHW